MTEPDSTTPDILVIGAGPAGLSAALAAAQGKVSVTILDAAAGPGGQLWRGARLGEAGPAAKWLAALDAQPRVAWLTQAQVTWAEPAGTSFIWNVSTPQGMRRLRPQRTILATGASEVFLPFPGWTLPGVVGAGGLQAMTKSGLEVRGKRVVVAGSGPLLLAVAAGLRQHGARVLGIAEQASLPNLARFAAIALRQPSSRDQAQGLAAALAGIPYWPGSYPTRAGGDGRLQWVTLRRFGREVTLECEYLAVGFGLVPDLTLARSLGCQVVDGAVQVDAWQQTSLAGVYAAGEITGVGGVGKALLEGRVAGCAASGQIERLKAAPAEATRHAAFAAGLKQHFALRPELRQLAAPDTIVCRCEDVCHAELQPHRSWTSAKLQTRCGMGACQGRVCGPAAAALYGWVSTDPRPPLFPVSMAQLFSQEDSP